MVHLLHTNELPTLLHISTKMFPHAVVRFALNISTIGTQFALKCAKFLQLCFQSKHSFKACGSFRFNLLSLIPTLHLNSSTTKEPKFQCKVFPTCTKRALWRLWHVFTWQSNLNKFPPWWCRGKNINQGVIIYYEILVALANFSRLHRIKFCQLQIRSSCVKNVKTRSQRSLQQSIKSFKHCIRGMFEKPQRAVHVF